MAKVGMLGRRALIVDNLKKPLWFMSGFLANLQKCVGGLLLCKFWRIFPGIFLEDFSGHFFPKKMRRKNPARNSAKKSGGPKIKIREKSVLPKTDPNMSGFLVRCFCGPQPGFSGFFLRRGLIFPVFLSRKRLKPVDAVVGGPVRQDNDTI